VLCKEILDALSDYVDGELEAELCGQIERHMSGCENCRIVVDTLRRTVTLYHEHGHEPVPDDVQERLLAALNLGPARQSL